jgi:preprotein translocase subunit SecA
MRSWWRSIVAERRPVASAVEEVRRLERAYAALDDKALKTAGERAERLTEVFAVTAVLASRILGLNLFDVQLEGALALADGKIVEMQTGEGKTLAAVPAIAWHARSREGVHVLTANDYLARRDAAWMGGIFERLGLSVGVIQQEMTSASRKAAYRCDITYATANEVGFDYLRDELALHVDEQVLRPFAAAVIDEADSALVDEARIPLVIAGGIADADDLGARADRAVRGLMRMHYTIEESGRNVALTSSGLESIERALGCDLFAMDGVPMMAAVQDALHAHTLLHRDIDYVVHDGQVLSVDEFKGRIVRDRRWPGGLQTALEWKERVARKAQGRVLGSITVENLVALYPTLCGMTGTAATQAHDFREMYGLEVAVISTNRPIVRVDHPDCVFDTRIAKEAAVVQDIRAAHASGRPVLVGTSSVQESETVSRQLGDIAHSVLNARNEEAEAAIIARAGEKGAVTISTNMAGRGVDIRLGPGVAELGGLHVVGTSRYESRRIDHQLRGRAGRQGDPGSSRFFVSREDALMVKFGSEGAAPDHAQRIAEGQNLDVRLLLRKYEAVVEGQRLATSERRHRVLTGEEPAQSELERLVTLQTIDELWADYLAGVSDLRAGTVWTSLGAANPFANYIARIHEMFQSFEQAIDDELPDRLEQAVTSGADPRQRGATWTYLTTDEPFGPITERFMRGLRRMVAGKPRRSDFSPD